MELDLRQGGGDRQREGASLEVPGYVQPAIDPTLASTRDLDPRLLGLWQGFLFLQAEGWYS